MKKNFILTTFLVLSTVFAFAQTNESKIGFGVKAGVNLANMMASGTDASNSNKQAKNIIGFNVTGYANFGLGSNFAIQPGISLQNKGMKYEGTEEKGTINVMAIEIPVNAVYSIPTGDAGAIQLSVGPYAAYNIAGKEKTTNVKTSTSKSEDLKFGSKKESDMSSMDFGANFGIGYRLASGITLGANYGLGLGNMVPKAKRNESLKDLKNRVIGFTVGYSF